MIFASPTARLLMALTLAGTAAACRPTPAASSSVRAAPAETTAVAFVGNPCVAGFAPHLDTLWARTDALLDALQSDELDIARDYRDVAILTKNLYPKLALASGITDRFADKGNQIHPFMNPCYDLVQFGKAYIQQYYAVKGAINARITRDIQAGNFPRRDRMRQVWTATLFEPSQTFGTCVGEMNTVAGPVAPAVSFSAIH
jgi:hypothetical protein